MLLFTPMLLDCLARMVEFPLSSANAKCLFCCFVFPFPSLDLNVDNNVVHNTVPWKPFLVSRLLAMVITVPLEMKFITNRYFNLVLNRTTTTNNNKTRFKTLFIIKNVFNYST